MSVIASLILPLSLLFYNHDSDLSIVDFFFYHSLDYNTFNIRFNNGSDFSRYNPSSDHTIAMNAHLYKSTFVIYVFISQLQVDSYSSEYTFTGLVHQYRYGISIVYIKLSIQIKGNMVFFCTEIRPLVFSFELFYIFHIGAFIADYLDCFALCWRPYGDL